MKSYQEIEKIMEDALQKPTIDNKKFVMDMIAEFGEPNYQWCKEIVTIINEWDSQKDLPEINKKRIKELGESINERGGKDAMIMNYYTMIHFMDIDKSKIRMLEFIWNGIGEWKS